MRNPPPRPMTHSEPIPHNIPSHHTIGPVPRSDTHAIRFHFAGGWDTLGTYPNREAAMEEYRRELAMGTPPSCMIVCRI